MWRLIDTGRHTAAWNMACDEALCDSVRAGSEPVVRFFQWEPAALSFGYSQRIGREVLIADVLRDGIGVVRRITGGRGVFHADELTYSVICRQDDPVAQGGITATYTRISQGLAEGLQSLGVDAELTRHVDPAVPPRAQNATLPCFGSAARAEIVIENRKLIGSAQHRMKDLMLQHGSIPLGPRHKEIVKYLNADDRTLKRFRQVLDTSTISLEEAGWTGGTGELASVLADGLENALSIAVGNDTLKECEIQRIDELIATKYGTDQWNYGESGASADTE